MIVAKEKNSVGKPRKFNSAEAFVLVMRHIEGESFRQIARDYDCPPSTIMRTVKRYQNKKQ
jgi:DNA-directed RNA polymerase specialized sigma24 family protein